MIGRGEIGFICGVAGFLISSFFWYSTLDFNTENELRKTNINLESTIDKIESCVQHYDGYKWVYLDNKFLCFDKEGKMVFENETGAT